MKNFALTGRLMAGKTWVGKHLGYEEASLAEPLYRLAELMLGTSDKKVPGVREFLQRIGQWGRGTKSEKYPLTEERVSLTRRLQRYGLIACIPEEDADFDTVCFVETAERDLKVNWEDFGRNDNIWLDALIRRLGPGKFVSNCRFENEYERFFHEGIPVYHVTCRPYVLSGRWRAAGLTEKELTDVSERLATNLDEAIDRSGAEHVRDAYGLAGIIWNDAPYEGSLPIPAGMISVDQFAALCKSSPHENEKAS